MTFAELHLPLGIPVDRDEVEEALTAALEGRLEITGAGAGAYGSNLDLEVRPDVSREELISLVREVLLGHGIAGGRMRFSEEPGWADL